MQVADFKQIARRLVGDAKGHDVMPAYERQVIEAGLADSEAGRVTAVESVRSKYGLSE